jgi:Skp family chaperone for outer membrane proteins
MKKTLSFVIASFVLNIFAFSQVKIGITDAQKIIEKSNKGTQIQNRLAQLQQKKKKQLQEMQSSIKKLEKEVISPALNQDIRDKKSRELQAKRTQLKRFYEDAQREIQRESQRELLALEKN